MRRIISGRRFDTEKATLIAQSSSSVRKGHPYYYQESLYQTPKGIWFLRGEGGSLTQWARPAEGGRRLRGANIYALSHKEVKAWLKAYASK